MFENEMLNVRKAVKIAKEKNLNEIDLSNELMLDLHEAGYKDFPNMEAEIVVDKTGINVLYNMLFDDYYGKYICSHIPDNAPSFEKLTILLFREGIVTQMIMLADAYNY